MLLYTLQSTFDKRRAPTNAFVRKRIYESEIPLSGVRRENREERMNENPTIRREKNPGGTALLPKS